MDAKGSGNTMLATATALVTLAVLCRSGHAAKTLFTPSLPLEASVVEALSSGTVVPESRVLWTGRDRSKQCGGTVTTLKKNEATVLKSHYRYGIEPYPEDYYCRWLFIPEDCELGIECDVETASNDRRSRTSSRCLDADYLRLVGYRGTMDSFYCGQRHLNVSFTGGDAIALLFRSNHRNKIQRDVELFNFAGFSCKIVCRKPGAVIPNGLKAPPTTSPTTSSVPPLKPTQSPSSTAVNAAAASSCSCGYTRQPRIVCPAGRNCTVSIGGIPWQAALVFRGKNQPWCGGSIISNRYVLTAAHCLKGKKPDKLQVILGDHDWTTKSETQELRLDVDDIITHAKFDQKAKFDFDFALVKLSEKIDFDKHRYIEPVCLPGGDLAHPEALRGRTGRASGWGVLDPAVPRGQARSLQRVSVRVIDTTECRQKYSSANPVTENMMCAAAPGGDACFGDSGGPFTVTKAGRSVLEGVISWGKSCANSRWPGVYARVRKVLTWIQENMRDSEFCSRSL